MLDHKLTPEETLIRRWYTNFANGLVFYSGGTAGLAVETPVTAGAATRVAVEGNRVIVNFQADTGLKQLLGIRGYQLEMVIAEQSAAKPLEVAKLLAAYASLKVIYSGVQPLMPDYEVTAPPRVAMAWLLYSDEARENATA